MARFQRRDQPGSVNQLAAAGIDDEYAGLVRAYGNQKLWLYG